MRTASISTFGLLALATLLNACSGGSGEPAPAAPTVVKADPAVAELAGSLHGLRAVREIKRLQHAWAQYAEAGRWRDMAQLMTSDAELIVPPDAIEGREAVYEYLREHFGDGEDGLAPDRLNVRLLLTPVINVAADGRSAKGRWHELAMTGRYGESADWSGGIHENDYRLEEGQWKLSRLHYYPQYAGPYEGGWHHVSASVPLVPYHYSPDEAGMPFGSQDGPPAGASRELAVIDAEADALLDASAVWNLQAAYGYYLDRKMWDDIADLFGNTGRMDIGGHGAYTGAEAIRAGLEAMYGPSGLAPGEVHDHPQLMPVITVAPDGQSAHIRGVEVSMTGQHQGESFWGVSIFDNRFVKRGGVWSIDRMQVYPRLRAAYASGWARALPAMPESATALPASAYPQHSGPPFEFGALISPPPGPTAVSVEGLRRRIAVARSHDGAENVANAYGYYIDESRWTDTAELFASDGWKELSYIGTYIGRDRIRESLLSRYGNGGRRPGFMAIHQKTQPYVTPSADGLRANIRLRLFQFNSQAEGEGSYISGIYENQAKLEDGVWKIHGMDLEYIWLATYTGGWAAIEPGSSRRFAPAPEVIERFPPDGPLRGVSFAPFPDIAPLGFHFRNPVSGREPPLWLHWSDGQRS